jgi:outer membrane protein OmpA-like peptidoglycan-associated protein/tetratricopeptide (TPR) repeat protein
MNRQIVLLLLLNISLVLVNYGQDIGGLDQEKLGLLERGDKAFMRNDFDKALSIYKQCADSLEDDLLIEKRIGVTYFKLDRYSEALPILHNAYERSDTTDIFIDYYLAVSLHKLGEYNKAIQIYQLCLQYIQDKNISSGFDEIRKNIEQCRFWEEISNDSMEVNLLRLDSTVNSPFPDYDVHILPDCSGMFFTSRRTKLPQVASVLIRPPEKIYFSAFKDGKWNMAGKVELLTNSSANEAILDVSADGKYVYIYNDMNQGDIMQASTDTDTLRPGTLPGDINTPGFTENSVSFDKNGNVCYFVSNRTDIKNYGKKDIFKAVLDSGNLWKVTGNLGSGINSPYDEDFVFWSDEDTALYFSSNRERSIGGFDIFMSKLGPDGAFMPAKNIGLPINTPYDDISFTKNGDKGWYSTVFNNKKEDIFEIDFTAGSYNPQWYQSNLSGIERIDSFNVVGPVYFKVGKSNIDKYDGTLLHLADVLKNTKGARVQLSGYSDWTGSEGVNDRISFLRAVNLAKFLVDNGVDPKILSLDFKGDKYVLTDTVFEDMVRLDSALQFNRCVQITVMEQGFPYLAIDYSDLSRRNLSGKEDVPNDKYAVMVYISGKSNKKMREKPDFQEQYSPRDKLYYYHTKFTFSIQEAFQTFKKLNSLYPNCYLAHSLSSNCE